MKIKKEVLHDEQQAERRDFDNLSLDEMRQLVARHEDLERQNLKQRVEELRKGLGRAVDVKTEVNDEKEKQQKRARDSVLEDGSDAGTPKRRQTETVNLTDD